VFNNRSDIEINQERFYNLTHLSYAIRKFFI